MNKVSSFYFDPDDDELTDEEIQQSIEDRAEYLEMQAELQREYAAEDMLTPRASDGRCPADFIYDPLRDRIGEFE